MQPRVAPSTDVHCPCVIMLTCLPAVSLPPPSRWHPCLKAQWGSLTPLQGWGVQRQHRRVVAMGLRWRGMEHRLVVGTTCHVHSHKAPALDVLYWRGVTTHLGDGKCWVCVLPCWIEALAFFSAAAHALLPTAPALQVLIEGPEIGTTEFHVQGEGTPPVLQPPTHLTAPAGGRARATLSWRNPFPLHVTVAVSMQGPLVSPVCCGWRPC